MRRLLNFLPWDEDAGPDALSRAVGIGGDVPFATKPDLAGKMIGRAVKAGVPFSWVAGAEVYWPSWSPSPPPASRTTPAELEPILERWW